MPSGWALKPSGLNDGDKFRLLFITSTVRDATATAIADYNTFVQTRAKAGHSAISDSCGNLFKVLGSTATVDARANAGTTGTGFPIYWLNGAKVANNHAGFLDGTWDDVGKKTEYGSNSVAIGVYTGSNQDGTKHSTYPLGAGHAQQGSLLPGGNPISQQTQNAIIPGYFYALSPVFRVDTPSTPVIVSLARVGTGAVTEGDTVEFTVTLGRALVAGEIVDVPLSVSGTNVTTGDWSLAGKSGATNTGVTLSGETTATPQVRFSGAGAQTATLELTAATDGASEGNETFTIALGPDGTGTNGFDRTTLGTNVGGGANPHATANSFDVVVADGITGSLTFSPASVTVLEGSTATYTVVLDTEPTGNVGVLTSVGGVDHLQVTPLLRFTTSNWNEPQTVTVSAGQDTDGADETHQVFHTASGGGYTGVTGTVGVTVQDDDVASLVFSRTSLTLVEGGSTTFNVRLAMAPSGTVTLNRTKTGSSDVTTNPTGDLTFTTGNWNVAQTVTVSAGHDGDRTNDEATVSYAASSSDTDYNGLSETVTITVNDDDVVAPCSNCVWVTGGSDIVEGGNAQFMLRASPAPRSALRVDVQVFDAPGGTKADFLSGGLSGHEGLRTVTIPSGSTAASFTVPTHDDSKDEPNSYVSAQARAILDSDGNTDFRSSYSPQRDSLGQFGRATARVNVADNDDPPPPEVIPPGAKLATFTLSTTSIQEDAADPWVDIEVTLPEPHTPAAQGYLAPQLLFNVCFYGTARRSRSMSETGENGFDYRVWSYGTDGTDGYILGSACPSGEFLRGETQWRMRIEVLDDSHEDSGERIRMGIQRFDLPKWRALGVYLGAPVQQTLVIHNDEGATDALPAGHPVVKHAPVVKRFVDRLSASNQHGDGAAGGWNKRFLKAMGHPDYVDYSQPAVTVADATRIWNHGGDGANTAWDGTVAAVTYAEQYFAGTTTPPPAPDPEVTITAGSGVTEGAGAVFTIAADPAPDANLAVTLNVAEAQGGDFVAASDEGARTVTVLAGETAATLTVATDNDDVDEPDGSVTATVQAGTGYTVGTASSGTVAIADDDEPVTPVVDNTLPAAHPVMKHAAVVKRFYDRITARNQHGDGAAGGWNKRFLKAMGHPDYVDYPQAAVTVADATKLWNHGGPGANTAWDGTVDAVTYAEQYFAGQVPTPTAQQQHQQVADPEVTIAAGAGIAEGGSATFVLTADPVPAAPLGVTVTVATEGAFGITAGERTVTIPTTGSYTLTLPTTGDEADEPDGSVTATVDAGTGYTVGAASSGTVAIADDDLPMPAVTIAAAAGVTEGSAASFVLTATPPPAAALEVTVTVAASGDYGIAAGQRTVTIPTTGAYTLTLATTGDEADEPDGSVTATVDAGTGYTVGAASSGTVAIADDDLPPPAVSVAAKAASITEGGDAVFTVTADRAVDANLAVALTVSEAAGSDFVAAANEGAKTVTILAGKTSAALTVRTEDDTVDEPNGSVTAAVAAGDGYTVGAASSGTVAVADNDAAGRPMVTVDDATAREGQTMQFAVRLSAAAKRDVWVRVLAQESNPVSARAGRDFQGPYYSAMVRIRAGQTVGQFGVRIHDDSHDDGGETFEAHVLFVMNGVAGVADGLAVGTIENDDPLPAAYLARFGRTVAEQALDGIAGRMSASRTPGMQGTVAGQSLSFDPAASGQPSANGAMPGVSGTMPADREAALAMAGIARGLGADASAPVGPGSAADPFGDRFDAGFGDSRFGTPSLQSRGMTARDALLGSSFSLTGQKDGAGGSLAFWGRASQAGFDGAERGDGTDIRLDGTVTTGMLGADYARGKWLVGLALTQSSSEGSYAAIGGDPCPDTDGDLCDGAVRAGDGDVEASLTAAIPYAALQVSERLKLWGAAGYGTGEVTLKTMEESYKADTSWTMAAAGVRGDLLEAPEEGSGPALALTSDALWARTSSDKTRDLAATDSDATRLRLGLEGSYRMALDGEASLVPKLEIGARHDGGDAETGFGVEVGGGIAWVDPGLGLSLDVSGRTLLAHENDDLKDRGLSASLAFDPAPATGRGPSFSLRQDFGGQANGGLDALFAPAPLEDRAGSEATSRWAVEAAYGFPAFGGRFTGSPHVGLGLATGSRDYSVGWRLAPEAATAPDISFGLRATRRESDTQAAEHTVGFEVRARW